MLHGAATVRDAYHQQLWLDGLCNRLKYEIDEQDALLINACPWIEVPGVHTLWRQLDDCRTDSARYISIFALT